MVPWMRAFSMGTTLGWTSWSWYFLPKSRCWREGHNILSTKGLSKIAQWVKALAKETGQHDFIPKNSNKGRRRELTLQSWLLTSICIPAFVYMAFPNPHTRLFLFAKGNGERRK